MKTNYYYKNILVKTSENEDYKYAVIVNSYSVIACSSSKDAILKKYNQKKVEYQKCVNSNEKYLIKYEVNSKEYNELKKVIEKQKQVVKTMRIAELLKR